MADHAVVPQLPTTSCTHCPASIVWARTSRGGLMPLDATPTRNGNVYLTWDPEAQTWRATVQTRWERTSPAWARAPRHVHHVTTCPRAADWSPSAAKQRGATPDRIGQPSGLAHCVTPGSARPVQEGLFP